jgi:molybdate transport system substrate-binding protein
MIRSLHLTLYAIAAAITSCLALFDSSHAVAAEIRILASGAVRGTLNELAPQFEQASGNKVIVDFSSAEPLKRRIDGGESFDIAILGPSQIDALIKENKIIADTRTAFGRSGLGVGVPKGSPKPDISSLEAFKLTLLNAKAIAYETEAQTGPLFLEVLNHLQLAQTIRSKLRGYRVGEFIPALQRKEVDIAILPVSALMANPAADFVGSFPMEIQRYVGFAGGVSANTKESEAAKAFLRFLASPSAAPIFKRQGFVGG